MRNFLIIILATEAVNPKKWVKRRNEFRVPKIQRQTPRAFIRAAAVPFRRFALVDIQRKGRPLYVTETHLFVFSPLSFIFFDSFLFPFWTGAYDLRLLPRLCLLKVFRYASRGKRGKWINEKRKRRLASLRAQASQISFLARVNVVTVNMYATQFMAMCVIIGTERHEAGSPNRK